MGILAIRTEQLGKRYQLGKLAKNAHHFNSLRDTLADTCMAPIRLLADRLRGIKRTPDTSHILWAVKELSLEIGHGQVVGVIGRNGSGKSTLLKLLARITEPTEGSADIYGRVGSLLEVGTGFHPELSGRENIYLSGAILGMKRAEIERTFDEIVAFAEIEKFLETPVKRYSSGMYVRLAFAVAAHLEPEILLVDEVLAVGDAAFQKKCLGRMGDVARDGRTVLFVSHNMAAVQSLCEYGLVLEGGRMQYWGPIQYAVDMYLQNQSTLPSATLRERTDRKGNGRVRITGIRLACGGDESRQLVQCGEPLGVYVDYEGEVPVSNARVVITVLDPRNMPLLLLDSEATGDLPNQLPQNGTVKCETGTVPITPGACILNVSIYVQGDLADHIPHALVFDVEPSDFFSTGRLVERNDALFLVSQQWSAYEADLC